LIDFSAVLNPASAGTPSAAAGPDSAVIDVMWIVFLAVSTPGPAVTPPPEPLEPLELPESLLPVPQALMVSAVATATAVTVILR
jgi:hypothetical protein